MSALHPESLLRIPLVEHVLTQHDIAIEPRPVDAGWFYTDVLSLSPTGFDPFGRRLYSAARSQLSRWQPHATGSARAFNQNEWLLSEALSLVHDYLHLWAVSELVADLWGKTSGTVEVTQGMVDDLAFIYVVSEAAATVGLDYWYLARVDLDEICPIGTRFRGLTTSYRERDIGAYQQLSPGFRVQVPSFLSWVVDGYCAQAFTGFAAEDVRANERLRRWLGHELKMSRKQLQLIRDWIRHLTGFESPTTLDFRSERRTAAVSRLSELLWRISYGEAVPVVSDVRLALPRSRTPPPVDYRFMNIRAQATWPDFEPLSLGVLSVSQFAYFAAQYVSSFEFDEGNERARDHVHSAIRARDFASLRGVVAGRRPVVSPSHGPADLIFTD